MPATRIVIVAEVDAGRLHPGTLDLAAWAQALGPGTGRVHWIAIGGQAGRAGKRLAEETGYPVTAIDMPPEATATGALWGNILKPCLKDRRADYVGLMHTTSAMDCAAPLAVALDGACITGVQGISRRDGAVMFERAVLGGKRCVAVKADCGPVVATILPGCFPYQYRQVEPAVVETHRPALPVSRIRVVGTRTAGTDADLSQAETIVAAGRGVGSQDNLALLTRLAACFPKSAVAGSRIVCDAGWLPYNRQVGITGATVAPRLYLACGISGTHQHVAGMQASKRIVAINTDPGAAIFNIADVGVVEDLETFLPLLIDALKTQSTAVGKPRRQSHGPE
jgi:electron transfer flavoprotein alpha subunit